jgi:hypothetical protein
MKVMKVQGNYVKAYLGAILKKFLYLNRFFFISVYIVLVMDERSILSIQGFSEN